MAERLPTTDLSEGKASADSSTTLMARLVVEYAVDFRFDPFSCVALGLTACSEGFDRLSCSVPVTDCAGSLVALSDLRGKPVRWVSFDTILHVPLGSRFCEVEGMGVGEIGDSILRFGCE